MFPLQQGDHSWPQLQEHKIEQDLIQAADISVGKSSDHTITIAKNRRRKWRAMKNEAITSDRNNKKQSHRDVERQRRQEMATLYSTLRNLLPLEFIKGKRSISDHMKEAVNYIEHQRKKIQELRMKRDELNRFSNLRALSSERTESSIENSLSCVEIHQSCGGLEILISSRFVDEAIFPLSRVLQVLLQHGRDVVNCVSTKVDEISLHTIQTDQVNDASCPDLDLSQLQKKLVQAIP